MTANFISYIPGTSWPAIPDAVSSEILALLFQFEKTQYLPPGEILKNQFQQLDEICSHSIETVPFYKRCLKASGLAKHKKIVPEQWLQVPVLSRSMVEENYKDLQSSSIPRSHGSKTLVQTSGTTGLPIRVTGTQVTHFYWQACGLRDHFWHQRDFSGKMAVIRHADQGRAEYPGVSSANWGAAISKVLKTGPSVSLNSSTDLLLQVQFLLQEEPDYLLSYPSNLEALARHFRREGLQLKKLRGIRAVGESLGSEVRTACREAWGVSLVDMFTAQEVGYIALQCPENENIYHVQAENLYVEVVDEEGRPCREGETGRVLVTTLHNFAMPLIRYEIGDYAEVGGACSCGRTLPVLSQIMGRKRNMLIFPNGERKWPGLGMSTWTKKLPIIRQFQFVQKGLDRIEARLVTDRLLSDDETLFFIDVLQKNMGYPFTIEITYVENIPRNKGGRFENFISEVV